MVLFRITDSPEYGAALGALTNQRSYPLLSPKNSRLPWQASEKKAGGSGPIAEAMLVKLLNYLFPDAEGENSVRVACFIFGLFLSFQWD